MSKKNPITAEIAPHLFLNPYNFRRSGIYYPLLPGAVRLFPDLKEGKMLCQGMVGQAKAGTFCDLHGDCQFLWTTEDRYYYELQRLGDFKVGDAVKITKRGGQLVAEKISIHDLEPSSTMA